MKVNRNLELALNTIRELRAANKPLKTSEVATRAGTTTAYLEQVANRLKRSGITTATKGPGGGISLLRDKVNALEVAVALGHKTVVSSPTAQAVQDKINEALSQIEV